MSDSLDGLDYYTLLGAEEDASSRDIKRAFKRFARKYHPDVYVDAPAEKRERASEIYRRGSEAFQVLTDKKYREAYDKVLSSGKALRLTPEEMDRAHAPEPTAPPEKKRSHPVTSPAARAYFDKAVVASKAKDWRTAWRALSAALELEPDNAFLRKRFGQVDRGLRDGSLS
jgi:curved DNA-binding protein CbpA